MYTTNKRGQSEAVNIARQALSMHKERRGGTIDPAFLYILTELATPGHQQASQAGDAIATDSQFPTAQTPEKDSLSSSKYH